MEVTFTRTAQIAQYQPIVYNVKVSDSDLPRLPNEKDEAYSARLNVKAYREVLLFEVHRNIKNVAQAKLELEAFKKLWETGL